jgi:L-asparaginase
VAGIGGDALVASADGGRRARPDVRVEELFRIGSYQLTIAAMARLAEAVRSHCDDPAVSGVVVTHGTDTMEESAYLADLGYLGDKPVVFTGAQRPADADDPDGPANLADAIRLARDPATRGLGVLVCMAGSAYAAAEATKAHSTAPDPWGIAGLDPVALVGDDGVTIRRRPARPSVALAVRPEEADRRVELVKVAAGSDGELLRAAHRLGAEAVVLEAFGLGNAPPPVTAAVAELVSAGVLVVVVTRCGSGPTAAVYGNGGGADLQRVGALLVSHLTGPKARMLVAAALATSSDPSGAKDLVERFASRLEPPPRRDQATVTAVPR